MLLERVSDAKRINEIVNHPSVYPWVKGDKTGPIDVTKTIENENNVGLISEHGCIIFVKHQPGIYEFHTSVLPEGRGAWMHEGASDVFHWMFTKTDAYELITKCPDSNLLSKLGAKKVGCKLQFRTGPIWPTDKGKVPVDVYSMVIQHWAIDTPKLESIGHWFHEILISEYKRLGRPIVVETEDQTHDRYVGGCIEMIRGGQIAKALAFYNRWAVMAGYMPIFMVKKDPLVLNIHEALIQVTNDSFEVV